MKTTAILLILTGFASGGFIAAKWFPFGSPTPANWMDAEHRDPGGILSRTLEAQSGDRHAAFKWLLTIQAGSVEQKLVLADKILPAQSSQIPALLKLIPESDKVSRQLLLTRWVELDAAAAGAWAGRILSGSDGSRSPDCMAVFTAWARKDAGAAMAAISQSAGPGGAVAFSYAVLADLLKTDPAAGIAFGGATPASKSVLNCIILRDRDAHWLLKDPVKAGALLCALPPGEFRDGSLCHLIGALAKKDFDAALALQLKTPGLQIPEDLSDSRAPFFKEWARRDQAGMTAFLNDHATGAARLEMKVAIASHLAEQDPMTGLSWASQNLSGTARDGVVRDVLTKLAATDPAAGREYLESLPEGTLLAAATTAYTDGLEDGEFDSVLGLAQSMPEGAAKNRMASYAYWILYDEDPEEGLRYLAGVPPETLPRDFWYDLAEESSPTDPPWQYLPLVPPGASADYVSGFWRRQYTKSPMHVQAEAFAALNHPGDRAAALREIANPTHVVTPSEVVKFAGALTDASERRIVADGLRKSLGALPRKELEQLLAPLK